MNLTATYSPEDNKLRLYSADRLDPETYQRVKDAGFIFAPKQDLFVAPAWTPGREDVLLDLCGEIGDEDSSLVERAEERAERFQGYMENRAAEAEGARRGVAALMDGIPLGQPILVGHHSERRARKDAERIENGMRRAVQLWETSTYWTERAAGALHHAKYKESPAVRARRIKTLEAERRKRERSKAEGIAYLASWSQEGLGLEAARNIANYCWLGVTPNNTGSHWTAWDVLRPDEDRYKACPSWTVDQVVAVAKRVYPRAIAHADRWIAHLSNRIAYERAMLEETGGTAAQRNRPEKGGACRCWVRRGWVEIVKVNKVSVTVLDNWGNGGRDFTRTIPFEKLTEVISKEAFDAIKAASEEMAPPARVEPVPAPVAPSTSSQEADFKDLREQLRQGVTVVAAPQLFPTPPQLARRMAEVAGPMAGCRVLEPSAGTGNLVRAILDSATGADCVKLVAVEVNPTLAAGLGSQRDKTVFANEESFKIQCADFLECHDLGTFDRILMNPPFAQAQDILHITHAAAMLRPGGRLVAICANGPRQNQALRPFVEQRGGTWEVLAPETFQESGTNVRTVLLTVEG